MFQNYFKTAWRNIINSKVYSAINILGLAAGMAVALLIALWVYNEYSYNRFLPGYENAYQVKMNFTVEGDIRTQNAAALPLAAALHKEIPELQYVAETDWNDNHSLMVGDKKIYQRGMRTGNDFLQIFKYPLLKGSPGTVFNDPYSIILTASTARSLFGDEDAMNKTVRYDNEHDLTVTGILADIPDNASMKFTFLVPFSYRDQTQADYIRTSREQWGDNSFQIFVALQPTATYAQVAPKIRDLVQTGSKDPHLSAATVDLHPLKDWRLYTEFSNGKASGGFIEYVRMFSMTGILVLLIACINFMNLSTARSEKRAREVGVRKTIGSGRSDLILQFLTESIVITLIAFICSVLLVWLALPAFNTLTQANISIPFSAISFWLIAIGFVLLTGLLAGARPAFYLSAFQPIKVLKGTIKAGKTATLSRKVLVVAQFTCSIALIISTIIITRQIYYVKARPIGYDYNRLLMTDMSDDLNRNYDALKNELLQTGIVQDVAWGSSPVVSIYFHTIVEQWPGKNTAAENLNIGGIGVSSNYFSTLGMQLRSGRDFSNSWSADSATIIINEAAARKMQLKEPLNQIITWNGGDRSRVIGVVKDAVMESPFTPVAPAFFYHGRGGSSIMYRLATNANIQDAIVTLAPLFNKYNPAYPWKYDFVDETYADKFNLEVLVGKLAGLFAGLAIIISCLGLFGLAAYMAEQRTKEIGIRKVLGASVSQVWLLLSKDFVVLVMISCVIASPIAWYFLQNWLLQYEYRIHIGPGVFVAAAGIAMIITVLTISFQAIRAALANPVKSLRSE